MAQAILRPGGNGYLQQWPTLVGSSRVAAVDPGPLLAHDDDTSYVRITAVAFGTYREFYTVLAASIPPLIANVLSVVVYGRCRAPIVNVETLWLGARLGGSNTEVVVQSYSGSGAFGFADFNTGPLARPGGGSWQVEDLSALEIGAIISSPDPEAIQDTRCTSLWAVLTYTPGGQGIESFRATGSRRLRLRRLPNGLIEVRAPTLEFLDKELLDLLSLSHPDLPSRDGRGAGVRPWERWPVEKLSSTVQWDTGEEVMVVRDLRDVLCTWWDVGKTLKAPSTYADGIARLDAGNARVWLRASPAWVRTPADTLFQLGNDTDKIDKLGTLFEGQSKNEIIQSGFKNGATNVFTGWTKSGTGSNGSNIVEDTTELFFDPDTTSVLRSVKLIAGSPIHVADLQLQATATATIVANTIGCLSIWHKDGSGAATHYAIQRSSDSTWWRDSDQTWQAAKTWNPLPITASRERHATQPLNVGGSNTTLTVYLGIPPTGTPGQINHVGHVQWEAKPYPTSVILTEAAAGTRVADAVTISNPSNAPAWPPERGVWTCRVVPGWDAADVAADLKTVAYVAHDAGNYDWIYYDGPNTRWVFERAAAGVTYRATYTHSPVRGVESRLAVRWTSDLGELGLPARSISLFFEGSLRATTTADRLRVVTDSTLALGIRAGADHLDGHLWAMEVIQAALADEVVARY